MHSKNICHRDIKLDNLVYQESTNILKIIDFGFASNSKDPLKVFCGTPSYMAPEIVSKKEYLGAPADIWACGIVLFVMLTGGFPFKSTEEKALFKKI